MFCVCSPQCPAICPPGPPGPPGMPGFKVRRVSVMFSICFKCYCMMLNVFLGIYTTHFSNAFPESHSSVFTLVYFFSCRVTRGIKETKESLEKMERR